MFSWHGLIHFGERSITSELLIASGMNRAPGAHTGTRSIPFCIRKPHLSRALGRLPMQRPFKLSRGRRRLEVARQNLTIRRVAAVKFLVGFPTRTERRAFQRNAREQPARTGIAGRNFSQQTCRLLFPVDATNRQYSWPNVNHESGVYSAPFFIGTKRTGSTDRVVVLPPADFCTTTSSWTPTPTGATRVPPPFNSSRSTCGISGGAAVRMIRSKG